MFMCMMSNSLRGKNGLVINAVIFPTRHEWLRHTFVLTVKRKKTPKSDGKGTVSKVTGKKITKIIGLGKKKPSTDEQTSSAEEDVPTCGKTLPRASIGATDCPRVCSGAV